MLNEPNLNRNDSLGMLLRSAYGKMTPPPALERAVKTGVPYTTRANAKTHFGRFVKAVISYAACIALLIGGIYLVFQLMNGQEPIATKPPAVTTLAPQNTDRTNDPEPPNDPTPEVVIPYTALPKNADFLLELAQYGSLDLMDQTLNALGLKLSDQNTPAVAREEFFQFIRKEGVNVYDTLRDPLKEGTEKISYTSAPEPVFCASYATESGEIAVIYHFVTPYNRLMMVLKPDGDSYTAVANFYTDYHYTGRIISDNNRVQSDYNLKRFLSVLSLSGNEVKVDSVLDEEQCDALKNYLSNSEIIETRISFFRPEDYSLYEFALSMSMKADSLTARKYGLSGNAYMWHQLDPRVVEGYYQTYLGITPTDATWAELEQEHWDGSYDVRYVEKLNSHFVYMHDEENSINMNSAVFKAYSTNDGRIVVYLLTDSSDHVTALLTPTADGNYHISAVQVLHVSNIPEKDFAKE